MMFRAYLFFVLLLSGSPVVQGQNYFFNATDTVKQGPLPRYGFLAVRFQADKLMDSGTPGLRYIQRHAVYAVDVRYGLRGYGRKLWHQVHHYPTFGVGFGKYFFSPSSNILGSPFSTYAFFNEPFFVGRRSKLAYDLSLGVSYGWKAYDSLVNPGQKALGSSVNVLIGLALQYEVKVSDRVELMVGPTISHFSNGRMRTPNRGLNLYGVTASLRYDLAKGRKSEGRPFPEEIRHVLPAFARMYEFYVVGGLGIVTTFNDININRDRFYWTTAVSADVARHYSYTGKYGVGIDWFYDGSVRQEYAGDVPFNRLQWWGVHFSHEYMIHRWTLVAQPGLYVRAAADKGAWFGRVAVRYDLSQRVFLRGGVRIYKSFRSDSIEGSIGYSLYKRRA